MEPTGVHVPAECMCEKDFISIVLQDLQLSEGVVVTNMNKNNGAGTGRCVWGGECSLATEAKIYL